MNEISCTVRELYEVRALLQGFQQDGNILIPGFINEKGLTEGTKRIAYKAAKIVNAELETIEKQRNDIQNFKDENFTAEQIATERERRDKELLDESLKLQIEKLQFSRVEGLALSYNYNLLYDLLFTD